MKFGLLLIPLVSLIACTLVNAHEDHCVMERCPNEARACFGEEKCLHALTCLATCKLDNPRCGYDCGFYKPGMNLIPLIQCLTDKKCKEQHGEIGTCYGSDADADQRLTSLDQLADGKIWWSVKGLDCGGESGMGWDNFPCTRSLTTKNDHGGVKMETSLCYGKQSKCESDVFTFHTPELVFKAPGVVFGSIVDTSLILPQNFTQRILSLPDPEWALVSICGETPLVKVNNFLITSTKRTFDQISPEVKNELAKATAKFGINLDDMCSIDNTGCSIGSP